jgi:hypothetical protein
MSQALSPSFARCYGLARVARVWKISRASVYRSLKETTPNTITRRPGPVGAVFRVLGEAETLASVPVVTLGLVGLLAEREASGVTPCTPATAMTSPSASRRQPRQSPPVYRLKRRRAIWQASSPGKHALQTSGLTV